VNPHTKDVPDPMHIELLTPTLALPVLSTSTPVCKSNAPLLVPVPRPLVIDTRPPTADEDVPADRLGDK
jgi:hypothetical protein